MASHRKQLTARFFCRPADVVACALLGKRLVHGDRSGVVVETEAYLGADDLASHARFESSSRNPVMSERGGTSYVYLCYGVHELFNVVTGAVGDPQAVLVRALAASEPGGERSMSGPGKLTRALGIDRRHTSIDLTEPSAELRFEHGRRISPTAIASGPRIGVAYAGAWADAPLRFYIADHPAVSGPTKARCRQ